MATMKTLDANTKKAFISAGINLTPQQEHVACCEADSGFDWSGLIQKLGKIAVELIPIILAVFGVQSPPPNPTPTPTPVQGKQGSTTNPSNTCCPCDHHKCCSDALKAILKAAEIEAAHLCHCCCE